MQAKARILDAAIRVLQTEPSASATIDRVAQMAGCAKGLVHYHYRSKDRLFAEAADRLWNSRADQWRRVLAGPDPGQVIDEGWKLLQAEAANGRLTAAAFLGLPASSVAGQSVKAGRSALTNAIADGLVQLFGRMGRAAAVRPSEIAILVASIIDGLGWRLAAGESPQQVEPAWAAFWAAVLSLTRPG